MLESHSSPRSVAASLGEQNAHSELTRITVSERHSQGSMHH